MRSTIRSVLLLSLFTACGSPVRSYSAPAPANALDCALKTVAGLGYTPIAGGLSDGYVKVAAKVDYTAADLAKETGARIASLGLKGVNRTEYDHLTLTSAGSTLRITAVGVGENGKATKATDRADGHVQAILSACGTPATHGIG